MDGKNWRGVAVRLSGEIKCAAANMKCTQTEELILIDNLTSAVLLLLSYNE